MKCRVCSGGATFVFRTVLLARHDVSYFSCDRCGYLQTELPFWLEEAYADSIDTADTGIMARNLVLSRITAALILARLKRHGVFLDVAGGYGIFVRLMRDMGFDFFWQDRYSQNLLARGFELSPDPGDGKVELITAMEVFEHFVDPLDEIGRMALVSRNILFSTTLVADPPPSPDGWWYYAREQGQHIGFYQYKTLRWIADHFGMNLCSNRRNLHLLTSKRISDPFFRSMIVPGAVFGGILSRLLMKSKSATDMSLVTSRRGCGTRP